MAETPNLRTENDPAPPMPPDGAQPAAAPEFPELSESPANERPVSFSRQLIQLVIIPAMIVLAALAIAYPMAKLLAVKGTVKNNLAVLRRKGGLELDKYRALHALSTQLDGVKDGKEKTELTAELIQIMGESLPGKDGKVHQGLILTIARLEQPDTLTILLERADSKYPLVRQAVAHAALHWPDQAAAQNAIPTLIRLTQDQDVQVKGFAAKALGRIATSDDLGVIGALQALMNSDEPNDREATWDAAIALAKMGGPLASEIVARVLLDRDALAQLPTEPVPGQSAGLPLDRPRQTMIILATLDDAGKMTEPIVWDKIKQLADNDPNLRVKTVAKELYAGHKDQRGP